MPSSSAFGVLVVLVSGAVAGTPAGAASQQEDPPPEVVLGKPSAIRTETQPTETVLVATGTRLYRLPDRRSTLLDIVGSDAARPVLERAEGWVMIRVQGQAGWAAVAGGRTGPDVEAPPDVAVLASRQEPLAPLPERLARVRSLLGDERSAMGAFAIYSDLADPGTVERLAGLVAQVPAAYSKRYHLEPWAGDRFALAVFAAEASYRIFEGVDLELAGLAASGHSAGNVAALYAEGRREGELEAILLHEMTHLLNRSAFRGSLPPWLEEGMAEDFSFALVEPSGKLDPARLGGVERRFLELGHGGSRRYVRESWGARATLARLVEAARADRLMPLPDLMASSRREMMTIEGRALRYGQSAFVVRFFLEGAGDDGRRALHGFLRRAAADDGANPDDLVVRLGGDWEKLERDFEAWLVRRLRQLRSKGWPGV